MNILHNFILKDLGIILWKLKYPIILTGTKPIQLLITLKLLMISDVKISLNDTFIQDVIFSMHLNQTEIYILTVDQINTLILPKNFLIYCWWVGVRKLFNHQCFVLNTPSLSRLKSSINAKRDLWNQIDLILKKQLVQNKKQ